MGQELPLHVETGTQVACNLCGCEYAEPLFTKFGYDLVRCKNCGLAYVGNPPSAEAVEAFYTAQADYHDELLDPHHPSFERMRAVARQHVGMLQRSRPDLKGLKVLDVGCSSGIFLDEVRKAGAVTFGAELSPETSAFAMRHFGLEVHQGDWRKAGFGPATFDVITLFDVIEHLPDPLSELEALLPLLKPGGLLLQSTPDIDGLFPRVSYPLGVKLDYWPHPEPPHHLFQFSTRTLTAMTERAGYQVMRADQTKIHLSYSFGTPQHWRRSPKMLAYAAVFAPIAAVAPLVGKGDWLYLAAQRPL